MIIRVKRGTAVCVIAALVAVTGHVMTAMPSARAAAPVSAGTKPHPSCAAARGSVTCSPATAREAAHSRVTASIRCRLQSYQPAGSRNRKGQYFVDLDTYLTCTAAGPVLIETERIRHFLQKWGEISLGHYGWITVTSVRSRNYPGVPGERLHLKSSAGCRKMKYGGTDYRQEAAGSATYKYRGATGTLDVPVTGLLASPTAVIACALRVVPGRARGFRVALSVRLRVALSA